MLFINSAAHFLFYIYIDLTLLSGFQLVSFFLNNTFLFPLFFFLILVMGKAFCFGTFLVFDFFLSFFLLGRGGFDFNWCVLLQHSLFFICLGSNPWPCTWSIKRHRHKRFVPFLHPIECQRGWRHLLRAQVLWSADTSSIYSPPFWWSLRQSHGELGLEKFVDLAVIPLQSSEDSCGGWLQSSCLFSCPVCISPEPEPSGVFPAVLDVVGQTVVAFAALSL